MNSVILIYSIHIDIRYFNEKLTSELLVTDKIINIKRIKNPLRKKRISFLNY